MPPMIWSVAEGVDIGGVCFNVSAFDLNEADVIWVS